MFKMGNRVRFYFQCYCSRLYASFVILTFGTTCVLPANAYSTTGQSGVLSHSPSKTFDFMWILEGLESFDEDTTSEEIVRFIAKVKIKVERFTGESFPIENLLYQCRETMEANGAEMGWDHFDDFVSHVQEAELLLIQEEDNNSWIHDGALYQQKRAITHKRRHSHRPDPFLDNANNQEILGALECFCGSLLCIIPWGWTQWVGGAMVFDGVARLGGEAIDRLDKKPFHAGMAMSGYPKGFDIDKVHEYFRKHPE